MKKIKLFTLLLALFMIFSLTACDYANNINKPNEKSNEQNEQTEEIENIQNEVIDTTPVYTSLSQSITSFKSNITAEQQNISLPNEYSSNVYEITESGNYYFSGELNSEITVAKNAGDVRIFLDGVTLSVDSKNAISTKKGANVIITLLNESTLSNTGSAKHIIDSKENLVINGNGTLTINSTKSAIACDKTFFGLGGTIIVSAQNHAVSADSIYIDGTLINAVSCGKDILHAESDYDEVETAPEFSYSAGFVFIEDGTINSTTILGDGISADSFVYIKNGTFNITTTPTWNNNYVAVENQEKGMFSTSTHQKVSRDSVRVGSRYAVLEESVKGIKVGEIDYYLKEDTEQENELIVSSNNYAILIEGGTFNINTVDDAIHTNSGSVMVFGGDITINTSDDAIHADTSLKISGNAKINVSNCYEGIEAQTIEILGGDITITALDDGVNATNSNLTENEQKSVCQINISGGRLDVTVNPNGDRDGIDSNGSINITGGIVISRGPNNQNACPLDSAQSISVTGGVLITIGYAQTNSSGMGGGFNRGPNDMRNFGPMGGNFTTTLSKTQSTSKGLSSGNHTISIGSTTIAYTNNYTYSGYTTVYATESATIA